MIAAQKAFSLGYKADYHCQLAVRAVLEDFAERFSLPVSQCTAWHLHDKLDEEAILWEVWFKLYDALSWPRLWIQALLRAHAGEIPNPDYGCSN